MNMSNRSLVIIPRRNPRDENKKKRDETTINPKAEFINNLEK